MDPLSFNRKPRIPNEVLEEWPAPSGVQPRVWHGMTPERRSDWLLSRYYHEVDGQWTPKPETRASVEVSQIAQCETTVAGANFAIEALIEDLKRTRATVVPDDPFTDDDSVFSGEKWNYTGMMILIAVVVLGIVVAALLTDLFGGEDEAGGSGGVVAGQSTTTQPSDTTAPAANSDASTTSTAATTTSESEQTTTSTSTSTTAAPAVIEVAVASGAVRHRDAGIVVNMMGNNLTADAQARGVVANWASTSRTAPGEPSGSVVVDPEASTVTVELVEAWTCTDACLDIWDYQDLTVSLSGTLELAPSGSLWTFTGPIEVGYHARCGRAETASDCGGTECFNCVDRMCTYEFGLVRQASLSGSIEGDILRVAVDEGLAADISTMDFSGLTDTEFFMSRYELEIQLPKAPPQP